MFNFTPQFGRFIKSKSEWASVPLAFVPFGYKIERSIINGRRYYRVSGPQLSMTSARSIEHARWLIAEAIRTSRITQSDTTVNDGTFDKPGYTDATVGVARAGDGSILIFIIDLDGGWQYGSYDTFRDLVDPFEDWLRDFAEIIDDLSADDRGLLFDLNFEEPFSYFEGSGFVSAQRFLEAEDVSVHLAATGDVAQASSEYR